VALSLFFCAENFFVSMGYEEDMVIIERREPGVGLLPGV
jgi:hypothetical protein